MENTRQVKYSKNTEMQVHYPDFIWVCIASFLFGGVCWYIGTMAALSSWFNHSPLLFSYLFHVLIAAVVLFYIRVAIRFLDRRKSWLFHTGDRLGTQFFFCVLLPTVFLFGVIKPVAMSKSEWIWLPLLVIFVCILLFNMIYTVFFYRIVLRSKEYEMVRLERTVLHQEQRLAELVGQTASLPADLYNGPEAVAAENGAKEAVPLEEINLPLLRTMDPLCEGFLLNNKFVTKKITYSELGIFLFEKTNNTALVKLFLKDNMEDSKYCEQRSLNEVVRDTRGYVQKIDRHHAIPLGMVKACYQLKGGRLRLVLAVPFGNIECFDISPTTSRRIKEWIMLQVSIEKDTR
ncbi:hypothetical protein ACK8HY_09475 [Sphingobacterium sp. NGMCC 1.201703]|uniref:hypothetical protein n=1 Tax=Sphingobacterium sp. NGMCC 1.201703 TaxID=3388657 RepID=UPI0039FC5850